MGRQAFPRIVLNFNAKGCNNRGSKKRKGDGRRIAATKLTSMTIAVLGLNHKSSRLEFREAIQRKLEDIENVYTPLFQAADCEELVILSTCNRIEIYFATPHFEKTVQEIEKYLVSGHADSVQEFRNSYYLFQDEDAIRHCFTVAPGLDSMIMGEPEILGQMKKAFQKAREKGTLRGSLMRLFEKAFQAAKEVRSDTDIGKGAIGTASVSMALAQKVCGSLQEKSILVLGAGSFGEKLITHLVGNRCRNITVSSRWKERGQELADRYAIRTISFSNWTEHLAGTDLFISATTQPAIILSASALSGIMSKRKEKPLCLIDLAVPRTIDPEVSKIEGAHLYNIEDLKGIGYQNLKFRENAMAQAYAIIHARTKTFLMGLQIPDVAALVPKLNQMVKECVYDELWPALEPHLLSADERRTAEEAICQLERSLAHKILMRMKMLSSDEEKPVAGTLFANLFQDELSQFSMPDVLKQYPGDFFEAVRKRFHEKLPSLMTVS